MRALGRENEFLCPDLHHRPARAMRQLEEVIADAKESAVALVGSSLGGYYATCLAERHALPAVLVNPAVRPYELLRACLGPQRNLYTGEQYEFTAAHLEELRALEVDSVTLERYLVLVATADEVLDYRMATAKYGGARQIVVEGGDHGFSALGDYLDEVLRHCDMTP